ncbi:MAG: hypothetical protein R6V75_01410 [Bacteroidales bacterium]
MIRKTVFLILLIIWATACDKDPVIDPDNDTSILNELIVGSGTKSFQRTIGGQRLDGFHSVKQTKDGGYVFCGFAETDTTSERAVLLLKTKANGETIWAKRLSNSFAAYGWHIEITDDKGYIIAATQSITAADSANHNYQGLLIKTDANGNQTWKHSYSFGTYKVRQTNDGGYAVSGNDFNKTNGTVKGILLRTDASGMEIWRKTYGGLVEINDMNKTKDGGFILCGIIRASINSESDIYIVRTNSTGDTLWTKTYGDASENTAKAIRETPSGNFVLCGHNANPGASGYAKLIGANGEQIWHTDFSEINVQAIDHISITTDNQFIAVGRNSFGTDNPASLQKIGSDGNNVWIKWFNPKIYNLFNEVQQTSDKGFMIAGYTYGEGYIVKTDADGN